MTVCRLLYYAHNLSTKTPCKIICCYCRNKWNENNEMLGLRWMCTHLWMNSIKRTINFQEQFKNCEKSMYKVNGELSSCDITYSGRVPSREGNIHNFELITSLKWIIQICSIFYCWVCKIAFYSPNPHCCLGKPPL